MSPSERRKGHSQGGDGLTVAVTGATGDIGRATLGYLDRSPQVGKVIGMARSPFDPAAHGFSEKVTYRRGDVLDREAVKECVADADVVMHLAFIIFGDPHEAQEINVEGSRNVFEAAVECGAKRLVYTSSVASYGFRPDNPQPLTEDVSPRGTDGFYYSAHKAELEALLDAVTADAAIDTYVFRPCIVAGPDAITFVETAVKMLPLYGQLRTARRLIDEMPFVAPVIPDPGVPFQLIHHDDVATALVAAVEGNGEPGRYNLAADGLLKMGDFARALGWWAIPAPGRLVGPVDDLLARVPGLPAEVAWLTAFRVAVVMDTDKAKDQLGWQPSHDAIETLNLTVEGAREKDAI